MIFVYHFYFCSSIVSFFSEDGNQIEKENALTNIQLPNFEDSFDIEMNLYFPIIISGMIYLDYIIRRHRLL